MKFSEDRATSFCNDNELMAIIRSHEPFYEGFESRESVISVYSCSDYGNQGNKAAIIHVMKNGEIVPKVLNALGGKDRWLNIEEYQGRKGGDLLRQLSFTPPKK